MTDEEQAYQNYLKIAEMTQQSGRMYRGECQIVGSLLMCPFCRSSCPNTPTHRNRFLRRHPRLCSERAAYTKQVAQGVRCVEDEANICPSCRGTGAEFPGNPRTEKCEECDGTGQRRNRRIGIV